MLIVLTTLLGALCTRPRTGWDSNCGRPFPLPKSRDCLCSTTMPNTDWKCRPQFALRELCLFALPSDAPGRTAWRSVGGKLPPRTPRPVIVFNEGHLKRLLSQSVAYDHLDRTHLGLGKQTPGQRRPSASTDPVVCWARLGGLHHRYSRIA